MTTTPTPMSSTSIRHPAKFSDKVLETARFFIQKDWMILDPFAGIGRVHELEADTWGLEIEPEWASIHPRTLVGDALRMPFRHEVFDCVFTSPTYGNRMADHHEATEKCKTCEGEGSVCVNFSIHSTGLPDIVDCPKCGGTGQNEYKRLTYRHQLGRPLHPNNSGQLQWGLRYQEFHAQAWREVERVLKPGGSLIINVSDHIRAGKRIPVVEWHKQFVRQNLDMKYDGTVLVETPRMKFGQNHELRVEAEAILLFRRTRLRHRKQRDTMYSAEPPPATTGAQPTGETMTDTSVVDDASTEAPEVKDGTDAAGAGTDSTVDSTTDSTTDSTPAEKKDRRPRGWLETDVKAVTDKFVTGEVTLNEGEHLTPHRIARLVQKLDSLDSPPSTGAVAAVLNRWVELGFIQTNDKPFAFVDYTKEGRDVGLTALKERRAAGRKEARAATKAEAKTAEAPTGSTETPVAPEATPLSSEAS